MDAEQQRALLTNLARDRAENLRNEIRKAMEEALAKPRPDLTQEQRLMGEQALQRALASAQRMVDSLNHALELAEQMAADAEADDQDESSRTID